MTLEKAISSLEKKYNKALKSKYINNPLAFALHQVWKEADRNVEKKEVTNND